MLYGTSALIFLSTLSLRRATSDIPPNLDADNISIHALLAESDPGKVKLVEPGFAFLSTLSLRRATQEHINSRTDNINFYPRSPCGERLRSIRQSTAGRIFLSTLSLRRATLLSRYVFCSVRHFYPRSPCGERLPCYTPLHGAHPISIHALLAESDKTGLPVCSFSLIFLSTLSLRRATEENPTQKREAKTFLSTLSLRRATYVSYNQYNNTNHFYPRSPCGERHLGARKSCNVRGISIHALLAESDPPMCTIRPMPLIISIHALLAESDSKSAQNSGALLRI